MENLDNLNYLSDVEIVFNVNELAVAALVASSDAASGHGAAELGWSVERATFALLRERIVSRDLTPALESMLIRYAGAVADRSAFLDLVDRADSLADLERRLTSENRYLGYRFVLSRQEGGLCPGCWMTEAVVPFEVPSI